MHRITVGVLAVLAALLVGCAGQTSSGVNIKAPFAALTTVSKAHSEGLITQSQYDGLRERLVDWYTGQVGDEGIVASHDAEIVNERVDSMYWQLSDLAEAYEDGDIRRDEYDALRKKYVTSLRLP